METIMVDINKVVTSVLNKRALVPHQRSLLIGISGIDGSGKGYVTQQIQARLAQHSVTAALINVDGWLNLPQIRFDSTQPGEHFYEHALRLDDLFDQLILPLKDQRSVTLVADFTEETATAYRKHLYNFANLDVVLLEGIFIFKQRYREVFDLAVWIDCSFPTALARALARRQEGLGFTETICAYETIYFPAQRIHLVRDEPRRKADLVLNNDTLLDNHRSYGPIHRFNLISRL
jgi:uridine kinase